MSENKLIEIQKNFALIKEKFEATGPERSAVFSKWQSEGSYPCHVIPLQFEILQYYFDNAPSLKSPVSVTNDPNLQTLMYNLSTALSNCSDEDAQFFYSQTIDVGTEKICMFDIFSNLAQGTSANIKADMEVLAVFLSKVDPSCIVDREALREIYEDNYVGPGFSLSVFRSEILPLLYQKASALILKKLAVFSDHIKGKSDFDDEDIVELTDIYKCRWDEIAGTPLEYTQKKDGVNRFWVLAARLLSGANFIPADYYSILMPTLTHTFVGPGVTLSCFREEILPFLNKNASPELRKKLDAFSAHINDKSHLSDSNIDELKAIYSHRWTEVAGTPLDYTQKQDGDNWGWIWAARLLSGSDLISPDYYNFLMPTLTHTSDLVTSDPLIKCPLSHYVLSNDGTKLILLDSSVQFYDQQKQFKQFLNCSVFPPVNFTLLEVERIWTAHKRYHRCIKFISNQKKDTGELALKRSTVMLIYTLLIRTVHKDISDEALAARDWEYLKFCEAIGTLPDQCKARITFLKPTEADKLKVLSLKEVLVIRSGKSYEIGFCNKLGEYQQQIITDPHILKMLLSYKTGEYILTNNLKDQLNVVLTSLGSRTRIDEELNRLYDHRVKFRGFDNSIKFILENILLQDNTGACITELSKSLTQLVVDYFPEERELNFPEALKLIVQAHSMRDVSAKKVFSDALCMQGHPINCNQILMASLLSYQFPTSSVTETHTLSFWDCENTTNDPIVKQVFDQLKVAIETTGHQNASMDVMTKVIQPLILRGKVAKLPLETQNWFSLVLSDGFLSDKRTFYDPKHLFLALEPIGSYAQVFLHDLLLNFAQPESISIQSVCINVKFTSFLESLDAKQRAEVQERLVNTRREVTQGLFYSSVFNYITSRFPAQPPTPPVVTPSWTAPAAWFLNVFWQKPVGLNLAQRLSRKAKEIDWSTVKSFDRVLSLIKTEVDVNPLHSLPATSYLSKLTASIASYSSRSSSSSSTDSSFGRSSNAGRP